MSVYISNLPLYTANTYNGYVIWNDSGETTTYKVKNYSPYNNGSAINSVVSNYYDASSVLSPKSQILGGSGNLISSTDPLGKNSIIGGSDNTISPGFGNTIIGGISATISGNNAIIAGGQGSITDGFGNGLFGGVGQVGGNYSAIVGGYSNIIGSTFNDRDVIVGGQNNIFYNASNSFIGGGSENDVYGATVAVVAGYNNTLSAGNLVFVAATQDNTITSPGYTYALIGGGYNTVNNQNNSAGNAMYSSYFCSDTTINDNSVLGNSNNWFSGSRNSNLSGYGKFNHITNTYNSSITNSVVNDANTQWFNKIDSSSASTITTSSKSQILGGESNTISGKTRVVMVGCSGRTASADNTTYTENHASFGQSYQGYFDNGSGSTFTIDWNNGNTQKMSFTGAGGITCNNTQTGAHYRMVINNPNGYTPTSFTATGRTIKFNGGSFVVYSGESICELFITNNSVFVNQLGLFS